MIAGLKDHPSSATTATPTNSGLKISVIRDPLAASAGRGYDEGLVTAWD